MHPLCKLGRSHLQLTAHVIICLVASHLSGPGAALAQQWWWPDTALLTAPTPRQNAAAIYDPVQDRLVMFGGRSSSGDLDDLWAMDLTRFYWQRLTPTGVPPSPRHSHNAVFDPRTRQMLIWSGRSIDGNGTRLHNDVHSLDLATLQWRRIEPTTTAPVARYGTAAIFDAMAGELVNFAGFTDLGRFDDTWRLDPSTGTWREVTMMQRPGARCLHAAAYDAMGERMIIFGGQRGPDALDDAWSLDLRTDTWQPLPPLPAGGRRFPAATFAAADARFYTFGGERDGTHFGDLWSMPLGQDVAAGGSAWEQINPDGERPPARDRAVLIYDERRHRLVLFGGTGETGHLNDTWVLPLPRPTFVEATGQTRPLALALPAVYPNPFNGQVRIQVQVPAAQQGRLAIHDLLGQQVRDLGLVQGAADLIWDGTNDGGRRVASGVYLLHLRAGGASVQRRVVMVQ